MIYCGISLLVNTRRLEIILKYFNFIKSLERIFTFNPVRQRTSPSLTFPPSGDDWRKEGEQGGGEIAEILTLNQLNKINDQFPIRKKLKCWACFISLKLRCRLFVQ